MLRIEKADRKTVGVVPQQLPNFWEVAAKFHPEYAELSAASRRLIRQEAKIGEIREREKLRPSPGLDFAFSKGGDERAVATLLACVEPALQADTIYNEYRGRYFALRRLSGLRSNPNLPSPFDDDGWPVAQPPSLEVVNDFVYSEIFHYDPDDPWIGLARLDSLTALPKDRGLIQETRGRE